MRQACRRTRGGEIIRQPRDGGILETRLLRIIPDQQYKALTEMTRVLRPGGVLLLADHVASSGRVLRAGQRVLELVTFPLGGEHFLRRPIEYVRAAGFRIERHDRFAAGIVERLAARKPAG